MSWNYLIMPWKPGGSFNIKMTSYQYRKSNCGDKTLLRASYLHNGIFYRSWHLYIESGPSFWQRSPHLAVDNHHLAPVPLSIFRSNSKFDENSECSSFEYTRPITTIFCTRHDSDTVVTCAKYRCDRPRVFYTRVFWIFIEFRIRSKYA